MTSSVWRGPVPFPIWLLMLLLVLAVLQRWPVWSAWVADEPLVAPAGMIHA